MAKVNIERSYFKRALCTATSINFSTAAPPLSSAVSSGKGCCISYICCSEKKKKNVLSLYLQLWPFFLSQAVSQNVKVQVETHFLDWFNFTPPKKPSLSPCLSSSFFRSYVRGSVAVNYAPWKGKWKQIEAADSFQGPILNPFPDLYFSRDSGGAAADAWLSRKAVEISGKHIFKPCVYSLRWACLLILMFCCLFHMFLREQTIDVWLRVMSPPRGFIFVTSQKANCGNGRVPLALSKKVGQTLRNINGHAAHQWKQTPRWRILLNVRPFFKW